MIVNRYNILTPRVTDTGTTINIPINQGFHIVDNSDVIIKEFVNEEIERAVNPSIDYERVRFSPIITGITNNVDMISVTYELVFYDQQTSSYFENGLTPTKLSDVGYDYQDAYFDKNSVKKSHLRLYFYDNVDQTTQVMVSSLTIKPDYRVSDTNEFLNKRVVMELKNPLTDDNINTSGFFVYYFKDEVAAMNPKNLFMKASYFNAKTGQITNFMTQPIPGSLTDVLNQTYTKYTLLKSQYGYLYNIDNQFSSNITITPQSPATPNSYVVRLYETVVL